MNRKEYNEDARAYIAIGAGAFGLGFTQTQALNAWWHSNRCSTDEAVVTIYETNTLDIRVSQFGTIEVFSSDAEETPILEEVDKIELFPQIRDDDKYPKRTKAARELVKEAYTLGANHWQNVATGYLDGVYIWDLDCALSNAENNGLD